MTTRNPRKSPKYARAIPVSEEEWEHVSKLLWWDAEHNNHGSPKLSADSRRIYRRMRQLEKKVYRD